MLNVSMLIRYITNIDHEVAFEHRSGEVLYLKILKGNNKRIFPRQPAYKISRELEYLDELSSMV